MEYFITADRLGRRYGKTWAVSDLSLNIKQGEVFGMLGPNGAGKTTTMRLLACLVAPSEGNATVCGYGITSNPTEVRKRVGILTESAGLYDALSAQDNLRFFAKLYDLPPREVRARADHYLKLLGLWDRRRDPAGTFSSGMKQKLSMARALIHEPSVLLLDEPTSNLDPEGAKLVRDFISSLRGQGRTIILCTHNLSEAQNLCDRVAVIKRTLLRVGTPRQLQTSLYGRQVEFRVNVGTLHFAPASCEPANPSPNSFRFGGEALERWNVGTLKVRRVKKSRHDTPDAPIAENVGTFQKPTPPEAGTRSETRGSNVPTLNDLAVAVARMDGVGDVAVSDNSLLVSMEDPDEYTPRIVRYLVGEGVDILHVAEVEHTLERAYLDLVSRPDIMALDGRNQRRGAAA